jgi:hypothetical protein
MTRGRETSWQKEFGLEGRRPPAFFASVAEVEQAQGKQTPQPHTLRRAFEQLELDGILCQDRAPLVYFRRVESVDPMAIAAIRRLFWNHGVAPILVLIARDEVQIHTSLAPPGQSDDRDEKAAVSGLVVTLSRVADELRSFILAVESGEFFRAHARSFDPNQRVDRDLLRNLNSARDELAESTRGRLEPAVLDALLCRLVFTCYLFDREIIGREYVEETGVRGAAHLSDILARQPRAQAKADLYKLFQRLGEDFNGDLFSDDLAAEGRQITADHLDVLDRFFQAADVRSGQRSFWRYDFGAISIEAISSIYEHFLKAAGPKQKKEAGAFYTPRFLVELTLDAALDGVDSLLDGRFLDPACGSGIFLVGLFNRMAEEWRRANPDARYDRRVAGLLQILREHLFGVDQNQTACRITAFSLYLAFLDQLSPRDIGQLQRRGKVLPRLVSAGAADGSSAGGTIRCADFFSATTELPTRMSFVIGNPPWGSVTKAGSAVTAWCNDRALPFPDRQIATAFVWKAAEHLEAGGRVCFVLPHGALFNHNRPAIDFQRTWLRRHAVELVINLADYQRFLFEESEAPALIVRYRKERPKNTAQRIDYWSPKTDWQVTQTEVVSILPQDRSRVTVGEVLEDLKGDDGPLTWKQRLWATPRDRRLLERLLLMARLRDLVGQTGRRDSRRWVLAEGFQPAGPHDNPAKTRRLELPSRLFIEATAPALRLILLPGDCEERASPEVRRGRSSESLQVFKAPHVLVTQGLSRVAYADFDVSFRHALRGIHGPDSDRDLLQFLAAYLRTNLARFFLFYTSSNWGISRAKVHVEELLRLPFPLPEQTHDPRRCRAIVQEVARTLREAAKRAAKPLVDREELVDRAQGVVERLVEEYFDVDPIEKILVDDTSSIIIPSTRPTRGRVDVITIAPTSGEQLRVYTDLLCETLNGWASSAFEVHGHARADSALGVGMVILEKTRRGERPPDVADGPPGLLATLEGLRRTASQVRGTFELVRGLKVFHGNLLYITKPIGRRFWTRTSALNDADEIAATILMRTEQEPA